MKLLTATVLAFTSAYSAYRAGLRGKPNKLFERA
jgi:hypothetical protein